MNILPFDFKGVIYRLANNWLDFIPRTNDKINYLEIGAFLGANVYSVEKIYASNENSTLTVIDPWIDYDEYDEYQTEQESNYNLFIHNTKEIKDKLNIIRDFSFNALIKLEDNSFDMIYIDGNHNPEYVLEDAVLSFRKLKVGGYLIFDDVNWGDVDLGINAFTSAYAKKIKILGTQNFQMFIQKI
jgi:hypothetical protein